MVNCCIPNCKTKRGVVKNISFHQFPANMELRKKWEDVVFIYRTDWFPKDRSVVCSKHFLPEDYETTTKIKKLKNSAVPSIFYENIVRDDSVTINRKKNMVRSCFLTDCISKHLKTERIIHEVPRDAVQRQIWLNWIRDECSQTNSEKLLTKQSVLCGLHFKDNDYNPDSNRRILLKNAVPSIGVPSRRYTEKEGINGRKILIRTDPQKANTVQENLLNGNNEEELNEPASKKIRVDVAEKNNIFKVTRVDFNTTGVVNSTEKYEYLVGLTKSNPFLEPSKENPPQSPEPTISADESNPPETHPSSSTLSPSKKLFTNEILEEKVSKQQKKIKCLKNQLSRRKISLSKMQEKYLILKISSDENNSNRLFKKVEIISEDAENKKPQAMFLKEQIESYGKNHHKWTRSSLQECMVWRQFSSRGYEHIRTRNILNLPSRTTISRMLCLVDEENGTIEDELSVSEETVKEQL